jgi:hypothetical protein
MENVDSKFSALSIENIRLIQRMVWLHALMYAMHRSEASFHQMVSSTYEPQGFFPSK